MTKVAISGILGTMGSVLKTKALEDQEVFLVGGYDRLASSGVVTDFNELPFVDVIIDFSHPSVLENLLKYAVEKNIALVLATTGYEQMHYEMIHEASKKIPIFYSENYSVGIHLMTQALKLISNPLSMDSDIEIIEKHHHYKKDHPSGTAIKLYKALNESLDEKLPLIEGRSDEKGVHVHALRLGSYVGEHSVIFSNLDETIEITHKAHNKKVFAQGALRAAKFIVGKEAKLYNMHDLLGGI